MNEFIDDEGNIISGDYPNSIDSRTTAKTTTDKHMRSTRQPFVFVNYRRYYGESELPFNDEADKCINNPELFYDFLKNKNEENQFLKYFTEKNKTVKEKLDDIAKNKVLAMVEDLFDKRNDESDLIEKLDDITIDEIREKDNLILGKLDRISEYIKTNYNKSEKNVILDYFKESING